MNTETATANSTFATTTETPWECVMRYIQLTKTRTLPLNEAEAVEYRAACKMLTLKEAEVLRAILVSVAAQEAAKAPELNRKERRKAQRAAKTAHGKARR